jgi:hypothetical protein
MKRWSMDFLLFILFSRAFPLAGPVFSEQWRQLRPRLQESLTLYTTNADSAIENKIIFMYWRRILCAYMYYYAQIVNH